MPQAQPYAEHGFTAAREYDGATSLKRAVQLDTEENGSWSGEQALYITESTSNPGTFDVEAYHIGKPGNRGLELLLSFPREEKFDRELTNAEGFATQADAVEAGVALLARQVETASPLLPAALALDAAARELYAAGFTLSSWPNAVDISFSRDLPGFDGRLSQSIATDSDWDRGYIAVRTELSLDGEVVEEGDLHDYHSADDCPSALGHGLGAAEDMLKDVAALEQLVALKVEPLLYGIVDEKERVYYFRSPKDRVEGLGKIALEDSRLGEDPSYQFFLANIRQDHIEDEAVWGPASHYAKAVGMADLKQKGWAVLDSNRGEFMFTAPDMKTVGVAIHTGDEKFSAVLATSPTAQGVENLTIGQAFSHLESAYAAERAAPKKEKNRGDIER